MTPSITDTTNLASRAVSSTVFSASSKVFRHGLIFITHIILMNLLQPADFGLMKYVTVVLSILLMMNESGLNIAIIQRKTLQPETLSSVNLFNYFGCFLLCMILFFTAPLIATIYHNQELTPLLRVGSLAFLFSTLSLVQRARLQRELDYKKLAIIEIIASLLSISSILISAYNNFGVWSLLIGLIAFNFFQSVLLLIFSPWPGLNLSQINSAIPVFLFGIGIAGQRIIGFLSQNTDYLIIGKLFGEETLGYYSIAYIIITAPLIIFGVITGNVIYSYFSRIQDNSDLFVKSYLMLTQLFMSGTFIFLGLVSILAENIMQSVTFLQASSKWLPSVHYIYMLLPLGFTYAMYSFPDIIWIVKKKVALSTQMSILGFVVVVIAILIGSRYGMDGVCIALGIKAVIMLPLTLYINSKVFNCPVVLYLKTILPPASCTLLMIVVLFLIKGTIFTNVHLQLQLLLLMIIGPSVYLLTYYILFRKNFNNLYAMVTRFLPGKAYWSQGQNV